MTTATNETFTPSGTSGQLTIGGVNVVSGAVISSMVRTDWQGAATLSTSSRTNILANPAWTGGDPPTSWSSTYSGGSHSYAASGLRSSENAFTFTATTTSDRIFLSQFYSLSALTSYILSCYVESVTGSVKAGDTLAFSTAPTGATVTYPACPANPTGGLAGLITTGRLDMRVDNASDVSSHGWRWGWAANSAVSYTGSVTLSHPMLSLLSDASAWISGTVTDYSYTSAGVVTLGQTASGTYVWSGSGTLADVGAFQVDTFQNNAFYVSAAGGGAANATPAGVSLTATVGTAAAQGASNVTPTGVIATLTVGTATAQASGNASATPSGVSTVLTQGTASAQAAANAAPSGQATNITINAPTANAAANASVSGVSAAFAVGTATANGGAAVDANATPSGVAMSLAVGQATASADSGSFGYSYGPKKWDDIVLEEWREAKTRKPVPVAAKVVKRVAIPGPDQIAALLADAVRRSQPTLGPEPVLMLKPVPKAEDHTNLALFLLLTA